MISWDRCGDRVIGVFTPRQIRWLRKHLIDYRNRVDRALSGHSDDAVISAVFANVTDSMDSRLQQARGSIAALLDALPARGGVVEICGDLARLRSIWTLHELRIALAVRLGLTTMSLTADASSDCASSSGKLMNWLSGVTDNLVVTGGLPLLPEGPHYDYRPR